MNVITTRRKLALLNTLNARGVRAPMSTEDIEELFGAVESFAIAPAGVMHEGFRSLLWGDCNQFTLDAEDSHTSAGWHIAFTGEGDLQLYGDEDIVPSSVEDFESVPF